MTLSRFFQGIEGSSPLVQRDELTQKTTITNHLLTLNKRKTFSKTVFACEQLRLEAGVQFSECEFPNLHLIEFALTSDEPYHPFDSCIFNFPLNLVCEKAITVELPSSVSLLSVDTAEVPVEIIQNGKTTTIDEVSWIITEYNKTVEAKYGTETSSFLDHYSLVFYMKELEFEEDPGVIMGPTTLVVTCSGRRLGQIKVEIVDHPFSLAVLESESPFINFNGAIPDHWARDAHPSVVERLKEIRGLSLLGGIGYRALTDLELDLQSLEVSGEIGPEAFDGSTGRIEQLTVESLIKDSFKGSHLSLDFVHLDTVEVGVKIEAQLISLAHSGQFHAVENAKSLIIRERFDLPIDTSEVNLTKIDFRTVTNPGPFVIRNFSRENLTFLQPEVVYRPIYGTIKASSGREAYRQVMKRVLQNYPEVKRLDQVQVTLDGMEIDSKSTPDHDGLIEVKLTESGALIARFAIHIVETNQYLFYGLWGLTLALGAIVALH